MENIYSTKKPIYINVINQRHRGYMGLCNITKQYLFTTLNHDHLIPYSEGLNMQM